MHTDGVYTLHSYRSHFFFITFIFLFLFFTDLFLHSFIHSYIYTLIHLFGHFITHPKHIPKTYHHHYHLITNQITSSPNHPKPPTPLLLSSSLPSLPLTHSRPQERKPNHLSPPHNSIQIRSNSRINSRLQRPFNPFFDGKLFVWRRGEDVVLVLVFLLWLFLL